MALSNTHNRSKRPDFNLFNGHVANRNNIFIFTSLKTGSITILDTINNKLYSLQPPEEMEITQFINRYSNKNLNYDTIMLDYYNGHIRDESKYGFQCKIIDNYIMIIHNSPFIYLAKLPNYEYEYEQEQTILNSNPYIFITPEWIKIELPLTDDELKNYNKSNICIITIKNKFIIIYVNGKDITKYKIFTLDPYTDNPEKLKITYLSSFTDNVVKYEEFDINMQLQDTLEHFLTVVDLETVIISELNYDQLIIKNIELKHLCINPDTNQKCKIFKFGFDYYRNIFARLIDDKLQVLPITEFIKDDITSKWIDLELPLIDKEREFIISIGIIEGALIIATYKHLYYTDIPIIASNTSITDFEEFIKTLKWKQIQVLIKEDYFKPKFTLSKLIDNQENIIETDLSQIWVNIGASLKICNGFISTIDGGVFQLIRNKENGNLIAEEIYVNGIKLESPLGFAYYSHYILYRDEYIIKKENIEEEHQKVILKIHEQYSKPHKTIYDEKCKLLTICELIFKP